MKAFKTELSNSSMITRYAFMSMMADATSAAMLLGSISLHSSDDKLTLLIILFNIISVGGRVLFSALADNVKNKHTGIRMAVMILIMGFFFPTDISIKTKVLLMAIGSSAFHAFASSSILSRSKFKATGIGLFTAGSVIGIGIAKYAAFFGYFTAAFLMMAATPSDKGEGIEEAYLSREKKAPKTLLAPIFVFFLLLSAAAFTFLNASLSFDWYHGRKVVFLTAVAAGVGRAVGGFIYDKASVFLTTASLGGGALLLLFCSDSKMLSLAAILFINMFVPTLISLIFRFMPKFPAFSYSIVTCFSYLGYIFVKLLPSPEKLPVLIALICGLLLLISLASEIVLYVNVRKVNKNFGGSLDE